MHDFGLLNLGHRLIIFQLKIGKHPRAKGKDIVVMNPGPLQDFDQIRPIFREVAAAGETFPYPCKTTKEEAVKIWIDSPRKTFVFEEENRILGTYFITTNQVGLGDHVCNCGYMVASAARGRGIATAMCHHSQEVAKELGYKAMQFNFVVSSNEGAVRLWNSLGFETVGRLSGAFRHPKLGYVDALVMYKWLA